MINFFKKLFHKKKKKEITVALVDGRLYRVKPDSILSKEELEEIAKVKEIIVQQ
jgi:hypothetical protein